MSKSDDAATEATDAAGGVDPSDLLAEFTKKGSRVGKAAMPALGAAALAAFFVARSRRRKDRPAEEPTEQD